ncbi:hypothetical protein NJ7G_3999 [Natrinema sp. J7-2]|nr:hypothetical protein NJ7G_3999 [Natrinema sp. J7-2]
MRATIAGYGSAVRAGAADRPPRVAVDHVTGSGCERLRTTNTMAAVYKNERLL